MFSHVYEIMVVPSRIPSAPFISFYLCSYPGDDGLRVLVWVVDDVLRVVSPLLHKRAMQHGLSSLDEADQTKVPTPPSLECNWVDLQKRAVVLLSSLDVRHVDRVAV